MTRGANTCYRERIAQAAGGGSRLASSWRWQQASCVGNSALQNLPAPLLPCPCRPSCWTISGCSSTGAHPRCWRHHTAITGAVSPRWLFGLAVVGGSAQAVRLAGALCRPLQCQPSSVVSSSALSATLVCAGTRRPPMRRMRGAAHTSCFTTTAPRRWSACLWRGPQTWPPGGWLAVLCCDITRLRASGRAVRGTACRHAPSAATCLLRLLWSSVASLFAALQSRPTSATPCRYMQQPATFLASSCGCGCGTDWQRCLVPLGGSRAAREAQLRDPALAIKVGCVCAWGCEAVNWQPSQQLCRSSTQDGVQLVHLHFSTSPRRLPLQELRHRLWDELPATSQPRQATPYLGALFAAYSPSLLAGCDGCILSAAP